MQGGWGVMYSIIYYNILLTTHTRTHTSVQPPQPMAKQLSHRQRIQMPLSLAHAPICLRLPCCLYYNLVLLLLLPLLLLLEAHLRDNSNNNNSRCLCLR